MLSLKGERTPVHFSGKVKQRDNNHCIISGLQCSLVASHLIPNRLPHDAILMILQHHNTGSTAISTDGWGSNGDDANNDERIGTLAFAPLDQMIDNFTLGFYCPDPVGHPDMYEVYYFGDDNDSYNVLGITHADFANVTGIVNHQLANLHRHQVTFEDRTVGQVTLPRPLDAAIRWHYMQCALRKLATGDYKGLPIW